MAQTIKWKDLEDLCSKAKTNLRNMEKANLNLKSHLDTFGRGDGEYAYWSGTRALKWFETSYKNVANNYVRMAKMANAMLKICQATEDIYSSDGQSKNNKYLDNLDTYEGAFKSMATDYYSKAKAIAKGNL